MVESDVMDAGGFLHQKPRNVCVVEEVIKDEGSLHQKSNEVCITTKLNRVNNGTRCLLQVGVRDWELLGTSRSSIQKGFGETVAEVMDAEVEGEDESHPSKRPRVAERVAFRVPPEVEQQNLDYDVNEFLRSSPNLVVASVFGD